ncbi:valyl-tRNA synthetase [Anseongella ginsenosidimutans]|uniref:Valine--tRNA ligase n=1 Tax=Anseongella ginsenosidimutans TaxID=496056 RepID=A0A4R3KS67_9SPHI|nr:valine--tRNA ligase [Anseongella ginsenosidimutans]QEC52956.1 valine--tRNA ligase [Anseongella ginsenosidimutans]TCS87357.1 valyl-tRNA synthetase [Anseongella ginsenosidimutans]
MHISKTYDPREAEEKWYSYWMEKNFFHSEPDEREPYTIVIPPPNVTGVLHMGHMLNNTIQDVLVRRARMKGFNACWVPGTDHASIATEAKVVAMLREKGISKRDLSRDEFIAYAWEWKEKYGGIILEQLKKLGASCDWERRRFTMDPELSEAVIDTFIHLYNKGLVYRGLRMVNWDPQGRTAVSDEEVIRREVNQQLYYVKYQVAGGAPDEWVTIATTRPETIMADTAICVNPLDPRFRQLHGKKVIVPLVNREIPVILDEYVEMDFGTGCLKVTPAHDPNDYELGLKHGLEVIDILNEDGTLNEKAEVCIGEDRFTARKKVAQLLSEAGRLEKIEDYKSQVGFSERTDAVIEPRLSLQWFVRMKELADPALEAVEKGEVQLIPGKFTATYRYWMENVKDWCISRQLWWGQRIPAWYDKDGGYVIAKTAEEALEKFAEGGKQLQLTEIRQDEDVVDTWFSSWLWPVSVFDPSVLGNPESRGNKDLQYYYPGNDLVTAPEILFFWVARMIMAGLEFRGEVPFRNVYLTGIVRDKQGRKMSKSLGNSPDPHELIEKYGADGVRMGMLMSSPAGNDLLFDESYCEQGRNFANKIWNAFRLIKGWQVAGEAGYAGKEGDAGEAGHAGEAMSVNALPNAQAIAWFGSRFQAELGNIEQLFSQYRLSEALMAIYKLVWDDFCSWYLEMIKPAYGQPIDQATQRATISFFEQLLKVIHPFMPFITEELWHELAQREEMDCIIVSSWPRQETFSQPALEEMEQVLALITQLRNIRNEKQISFKVTLPLSVKTANEDVYRRHEEIIRKLANIEPLSFVKENVAGLSFLVKTDEFFVDLGRNIDVEAEKDRIAKELAYLQGFLRSVRAKLGNERFVQNARAEVVENERKKEADAAAKISALEKNLASLE